MLEVETIRIAQIPKCSLCDSPAYIGGMLAIQHWCDMCNFHFKKHGREFDFSFDNFGKRQILKLYKRGKE